MIVIKLWSDIMMTRLTGLIISLILKKNPKHNNQ